MLIRGINWSGLGSVFLNNFVLLAIFIEALPEAIGSSARGQRMTNTSSTTCALTGDPVACGTSTTTGVYKPGETNLQQSTSPVDVYGQPINLKTTSSTSQTQPTQTQPTTTPKVGTAPAPEKTNGTNFSHETKGSNKAETAAADSNSASERKINYSAEEIRAFTASGGFRNLEAPVELDSTLPKEGKTQAASVANSKTKSLYSLEPSERDRISATQNEERISHSQKLDSLLLSDDPWVAQMARNTLPAMVNQIKGSEEMRKTLKERLEALIAKRPNLTEKEEQLATMMEVALEEAEQEDPAAAQLAELKSMNLQEAFKLDPEDTRAGVDRMIAELQNDAEFMPKQSLFERVSSAYRKVVTEKRL